MNSCGKKTANAPLLGRFSFIDTNIYTLYNVYRYISFTNRVITRECVMNESIQLRNNAFHEAGHVVMARLMGIKIVNASVTEREGTVELAPEEFETRGKAFFSGLNIKNALFPLVFVSLAGIVSERLTDWEHHRARGADDDEYHAEKYLAEVAKHESGVPSIFTFVDETKEVLEKPENLAMIRKVAEELVRKHELSAREIDSLLQR